MSLTWCAFVAHSVDLYEPLLSDKVRKSAMWQSWVTHVEYCKLGEQKEFSMGDIIQLDKLIYKMHKLFRQEWPLRP